MKCWFAEFFSSKCAFVNKLMKLHIVLENRSAEFIWKILCKGKNFAQQSSKEKESLLDNRVLTTFSKESMYFFLRWEVSHRCSSFQEASLLCPTDKHMPVIYWWFLLVQWEKYLTKNKNVLLFAIPILKLSKTSAIMLTSALWKTEKDGLLTLQKAVLYIIINW